MSTNFRELLQGLASYAACVRTGVDRAVYDETGKLLGYWQTPAYLDELLEKTKIIESLLAEGDRPQDTPAEVTDQEPAERLSYERIDRMHGRGGYWCQTDAVYIKADHPSDAVTRYRDKLASGEIGVTTHLPCIADANLRKIQEDWRYRLVQRLYDDVPRLQSIDTVRAKVSAINDIELLRFVLLVAVEMHCVTGNWLGHASTLNAVHDSRWRFTRVLWGLGINMVGTALTWRGSLIEALERAGFRASEDGDIRRILAGQPGWEYAKGETLAEFVARSHEGTEESQYEDFIP